MRTAQYAAATAAASSIAIFVSNLTGQLWTTITMHLPF
jgi:hypothetical protein